MNFMDAVNNMINGKRLIRQGWGGMYLAILSGQNFIWSIGSGSGKVINASIYTPNIDDIFAADWIVIIT